MKAKVILSALAMPVLFAACSSDELIPMEQGQGQQERPTLSKDFVIRSVAEGMKQDTRYAINQTSGGTLQFVNTGTNTDQFGVTTVDTYDANTDPEYWKINGWQGGGNYPFTYNEGTGEWTSPFRVGIGHNVFVFPYDKTDNARGAVQWSLPTVQWLVDNVDETTGEPTANSKYDINGAVLRGNKAVAGAVFGKDEWENQSYDVKVRNLFAYPMFRVVIDNQYDVRTISRVVLELKEGTENDKGFLVGGGLDHKGIFNIYDKGDGWWNNGTQYADIDSEWENVIRTSELVLEDDGSKEYNMTVATPQYSKYIVVNIPEGEQAVKNDNDNNKYIDVRFMIPGYATNSAGNMKNVAQVGNDDASYQFNMYVYTDKGVWQIEDLMDNLKFNENTTPETKQRLLARNSSYWMTTQHDAAEYDKDAPHIVTNVNDWNAYVAQYGANRSYTANAPFVVNLLNGFELTSACNMPSAAIFKIAETNVYVAKDGETCENSGEAYELNNLIVNKLIIGEDANVTFGDNLTVSTVENEGNLFFGKRRSAYTEPVSGKFCNHGTITIDAGAEVEFTALTNESSGSVVNNGTKAVLDKVTNYGTITNNTLMVFENNSVNEDSDETHKNAGLIVNNKELDGNDALTNKGNITQNGYLHDVKGDETVKGRITVTSTVGETELQDNNNIVDITAKWDAYVKYRTNINYDNFAYSINEGDTKTFTELQNKGLEEITLNGGTIKGTTGDKEVTNLSKSFEVTSNGGVIKGEGTSKNSISALVELYGDVQISGVNFTGGVNIKSGHTTVTGDVKVAEPGVVMGYTQDWYPYQVGATLTVNDGKRLDTWYLESGSNDGNGEKLNTVWNYGTICSYKQDANKKTVAIVQTNFKWNDGDADTAEDGTWGIKTETVNKAETNLYKVSYKIGADKDVPTFGNAVSAGDNAAGEHVYTLTVEKATFAALIEAKKALDAQARPAVNESYKYYENAQGTKDDIVEGSETELQTGYKFEHLTGDIVIAANVDLSNADEFAAFKTFSGANVTIEAGNAGEVEFSAGNHDGLSVGRLILKSNGGTIKMTSGGVDLRGKTWMTVGDFDYTGMASGSINIVGGNILIKGTAAENSGEVVDYGQSSAVSNYDESKGYLIIQSTENNRVTYLVWNFSTHKWEAM